MRGFKYEMAKLESLFLHYHYKGYFVHNFNCKSNSIKRFRPIAKNTYKPNVITPSMIIVTLVLNSVYPEPQKVIEKYKSHHKYMNIIVDITCQLITVLKTGFTAFCIFCVAILF